MNQRHLLTVCLEPEGVTSGMGETVDEDRGGDKDISEAGLEGELTGLSGLVDVEFLKECVFVPLIHPELFIVFAQQ